MHSIGANARAWCFSKSGKSRNSSVWGSYDEESPLMTRTESQVVWEAKWIKCLCVIVRFSHLLVSCGVDWIGSKRERVMGGEEKRLGLGLGCIRRIWKSKRGVAFPVAGQLVRQIRRQIPMGVWSWSCSWRWVWELVWPDCCWRSRTLKSWRILLIGNWNRNWWCLVMINDGYHYCQY